MYNLFAALLCVVTVVGAGLINVTQYDTSATIASTEDADFTDIINIITHKCPRSDDEDENNENISNTMEGVANNENDVNDGINSDHVLRRREETLSREERQRTQEEKF